MPKLLVGIRYMLIVLPAVGSMYVERYAAGGLFVCLALLLLWIAVLRRLRLPDWTALPLLWAETGYGAWLAWRYDGFMFLVLFAAALSFERLEQRPGFRAPVYWALQLALLNVALAGRPPLLWASAAGLFAAFALVLLHAGSAVHGKAELEQLYDQLRRKHYELDEARERLADYAAKVEAIAQAEERNRISRDIHDELGHKLIRLKMMAEAAVRVGQQQPGQGVAMLESIRDQLGDSMELLRATVRRLKPDEAIASSYTLDRLIAELGEENGIAVSQEIAGFPVPLYPSLHFVLYRNAKEAVTNAIRHGAATEVRIALHYGVSALRMRISNNGVQPQERAAWGMGLQGMEERTRLVGGSLQVEDNGPFAVTTVVPLYRETLEAQKEGVE